MAAVRGDKTPRFLARMLGGFTSKPTVKDLGEGVWLRIYTRSQRAIDRYHQILAKTPDGTQHNQLIELGNRLIDVHENIFDVCVRAQQAAPSNGFEVPAGADGRMLGVHRSASKIPTLIAQAAEAAMMARVALSQSKVEDANRSVTAVARTVELVEHAYTSLAFQETEPRQ